MFQVSCQIVFKRGHCKLIIFQCMVSLNIKPLSVSITATYRLPIMFRNSGQIPF